MTVFEMGDETDVDCGGPIAPSCADGRMCSMADDCLNRVCNGGLCAQATDTDAVQNGDETDVDCGGPTAPPCGDGKNRSVGRDCTSAVCAGGLCALPACDDGVTNGDETDRDCGGVCPACGDGQNCDGDATCRSGHCTVDNTCALTRCGDGYVAVTEDCDDMNDDPSDGCSADCRILTADQCNLSCNAAGSVVGPTLGQLQKVAARDSSKVTILATALIYTAIQPLSGLLTSSTNVGNVGAACVFQRINGEWRETQKLVPNNPEHLMQFGYSVAIHGDVIAVGAPQQDSRVGEVYIFERQMGIWSQTQTLKPSAGQNTSYFGVSLDMSASSIVVGAPHDNEMGSETGAAYWFQKSGNNWSLLHKLTLAMASVSGNLGHDVATFGNYAFAGAPGFSGREHSTGAVYVFTDASPRPLVRLEAPNPRRSARFGERLAASGDTLAVAAPYDTNDGVFTGAVVFFERFNNLWLFDQNLTASDRAVGRRFGHAMDLDGDDLIVGSLDSRFGRNSGSAYAVQRTADGWVETSQFYAEDAVRRPLRFGGRHLEWHDSGRSAK